MLWTSGTLAKIRKAGKNRNRQDQAPGHPYVVSQAIPLAHGDIVVKLTASVHSGRRWGEAANEQYLCRGEAQKFPCLNHLT